VTGRAAARREGAGAGLDRRRIFHRDRWLVDRMPIDRGVTDMLQRPGDDAEVGLGRGDIIKAAEEEHSCGNRNDDGQSADKAEEFHGEPLVFRAISSSVEPESHGVFG